MVRFERKLLETRSDEELKRLLRWDVELQLLDPEVLLDIVDILMKREGRQPKEPPVDFATFMGWDQDQ